MGRTKKVGIAGKFGARYGYTLRMRYKNIMEKKLAPHKCPRCGFVGYIKRLSVGIWFCKKCEYKFAGAAYTPRSER